MKAWKWLFIPLSALALPWFNSGMEAQKDNLPRLPGAVLLVGFPPSSLKLTSPSGTWTVAESEFFFFLNIYPSLSRDGMTVAATLTKDDGVRHSLPLMSIATYSVLERKWTEYQSEYKDVQNFQGAIAIAPDASKLAFPVKKPPWSNPRVEIHVIDLDTGMERMYPANGRHSNIHMSWSPDGRRIVYDTSPRTYSEGAREYLPEIYILDLETGRSTKIANGEKPAWSPSGGWIAYLHLEKEFIPHRKNPNKWAETLRSIRLMLARPDGTDSRVLCELRSVLAGSPVWSPDSKTILLNEWRDPGFLDELLNRSIDTVDICLLDLATLKVTRKFRASPPVFGWAEAK